MCGRFTLKTPTETIASLFQGLEFPDLKPRYNIAPTQDIACVRENQSDVQEFVWLRWGLVPFWAKDLKIGSRMINARSETVAIKPAFRSAFKSRRCLVLADGFFEWKKEGTQKQPFYITRTDELPFCMAGLWERWTNKESSEAIETCTILTTMANEIMRPLHDRMPVILDQRGHAPWLDRDFNVVQQLEKLLVPCESELLKTRPVNKIVNRPIVDSPDCIAPA